MESAPHGYLVYYDPADDLWHARPASKEEATEAPEDVFVSAEDASTEAGIRSVSYPPPAGHDR